jgi:DNA-binding PadR family transcriptional regulator
VDRSLSTLELTALGIVWKKGPCTAYAVMREFSGSQTVAYRSGAGSIYPLLKRLGGAGFLSLVGDKLSITPLGVSQLKAWDPEVSTNLDPLRSRVYFLGVLSVEEQRSFLSQSLLALKALLKEAKAGVKAYRDAGQEMSALAMTGAVYETEARIKFVKELEKALG